jgi:uncharacterized protein
MILKEKLREIIKSQRDIINNLDSGIERNIKININNSFVLVLTGIRRSGKSTFLNQILKKEKKGYYLNLEDPRLEGFELEDFNKVEEIMIELYGKNEIFFFDEIQNIKKWEKYIRYLIDKKERVIITGSNASLLNSELGTKLTGRYLTQEIFPFSFEEYVRFKKKNINFEDYLMKGGFPEYLKLENPNILQQLLMDILLKDIVVRHRLKNVEIIKRLTIYLISNIGKKFSYNSLKKILQIKSTQTIIDYISYLEDTYMIFTIPKFSYSHKQEIVNQKKIYAIDNGFININSTSFSKNKGRILENYVFLELRKKNKKIYYYSDKNECDFVIKDKEKIIEVIQTCWEINDENKNREIQGLLEAMNNFKLNEGTIITRNQQDKIKIDNKIINIIPIEKWIK